MRGSIAEDYERRYADLANRIGNLERPERAPKSLKPLEDRFDTLYDRVSALEARCHQLEHERAASVQSQIADLQERVGELEERCAIYIPVGTTLDDHRDKERPVKPPELVRCEDYQHCIAVCSTSAAGDHRSPHQRRPDCGQPCDHGKARCIPVPASPVDAIPDVPTPVGTEAFRAALMGHTRELSEAYGYLAAAPDASAIDAEPLERLAGVACAIRDAYELARCGENEAADKKLREIEW